MERNDKDCLLSSRPNPTPDLKIEPFEVSTVYGVSINSSIVIPRDIDTILAKAKTFKQAKEIAFKEKTIKE